MISDADLEMAETDLDLPGEEPGVVGWRYRNGGTTVIPLRAEDLLNQEEGDKIVTNTAHIEDMQYLFEALTRRTRGKPGIRVFSDHCINFQVRGLGILGPDVILFNGEDRPWDKGRGTFPVKAMKARPLYAFEVTSPSTRPRDLRARLSQFFRAGVPVYVVIDAPYGGGRHPLGVVAFQAGPDGYEQLPAADDGRVWVEVAEVYLGLEDGRLMIRAADGKKVPTGVEAIGEAMDLREQVEREEKRTERARKKAAAADKKAAAADKKAAAEKARADAAEQKMKEMEAELRRLRGE